MSVVKRAIILVLELVVSIVITQINKIIMKTLEEQIKLLADYTPRYVDSFHHAEGHFLQEAIMMAYKERVTAETLKESIKSAFDERNTQDPNQHYFFQLDSLKQEIDNSVNYVYQFLKYLQENNLLEEK